MSTNLKPSLSATDGHRGEHALKFLSAEALRHRVVVMYRYFPEKSTFQLGSDKALSAQARFLIAPVQV